MARWAHGLLVRLDDLRQLADADLRIYAPADAILPTVTRWSVQPMPGWLTQMPASAGRLYVLVEGDAHGLTQAVRLPCPYSSSARLFPPSVFRVGDRVDVDTSRHLTRDLGKPTYEPSPVVTYPPPWCWSWHPTGGDVPFSDMRPLDMNGFGFCFKRGKP